MFDRVGEKKCIEKVKEWGLIDDEVWTKIK